MPTVQAIILAGGPATRLGVLSEHRTEAAVPFAGKYRLIDFTLSNCVNSGIYNIAVLTQYRPHSLNEHIGIGRPWDLDRQTGGIQILQPYLARDAQDWHRGPADAVYQNWRFFDPKADAFLILSGDHVYKMDYSQMIRAHTERRADVTLAITNVPASEASRYGIVTINRQNRITQFWEKPSEPRGALASMGVYLFNREVLETVLTGQNGKRPYNFGPEVFPSLVQDIDVFAFPFLGYYADVGAIRSYWDAQMALLEDNPALDLYDPDWVIHTRSEERPPVKTTPGALIHRSMVSNGCQIGGVVENSILSPGVVVEPGAIVRHAIIMTDSYIGPDAVVEYAILDKQVRVETEARVGGVNATERGAHRQAPSLTLVGKGATVPARTRLAAGMVVPPNAALQHDA